MPPIQTRPAPTRPRTPQESGFLVLLFGAATVVAVAGIGTYGIPYVVASGLGASVSCLETWSMVRPDPPL